MRPLFDNVAFVYDINPMCLPHQAQPVGDDADRARFHF
jgi:hypothetical protein